MTAFQRLADAPDLRVWPDFLAPEQIAQLAALARDKAALAALGARQDADECGEVAEVPTSTPLLTSYIPEAVHWRLVVVGDRVVSAYRNVMDDGDFRTSGSDDADDYNATPPEGAEALAIAACQVLRHGHGGVDVLEHPSGRLYLLEANFPCYYASGQLEAGHDVAGPMVDYLLGRAVVASPEPSGLPMPRLVG